MPIANHSSFHLTKMCLCSLYVCATRESCLGCGTYRTNPSVPFEEKIFSWVHALKTKGYLALLLQHILWHILIQNKGKTENKALFSLFPSLIFPQWTMKIIAPYKTILNESSATTYTQDVLDCWFNIKYNVLLSWSVIFREAAIIMLLLPFLSMFCKWFTFLFIVKDT